MPDSFVEAQHEAAHAFFSANGYLDHATASELQVCPHHLSIARLSKMCACSWLPGLQPCRSWRVSSRVRSLCTENAPMVVDLFTPRLSVWTFMSSLVGAGARQPASGCIAILCLRKTASRSRVGLFRCGGRWYSYVGAQAPRVRQGETSERRVPGDRGCQQGVGGAARSGGRWGRCRGVVV